MGFAKPSIILFLILAFIPMALFGQTLPAWVLFQQAEEEYRAREYGKALQLYGEALAAQPLLPEAQVGMARIYRAESDYVLAERFYLLALENSHHLVVPEDAYAIRVELAEMYQFSGREEQRRQYRGPLEEIVADDPVFSFPENRWQRDAMTTLLYSRGFDRVMVLYRLDFPQSTEAHRRLGTLDIEEGNFDAAVEHLLFAAMEEGGRIVKAVLQHAFDFQFSTLIDLFQTAQLYDEITDYIERSTFRETLSLLAEALDLSDREGSDRQAEAIRASLQF